MTTFTHRRAQPIELLRSTVLPDIRADGGSPAAAVTALNQAWNAFKEKHETDMQDVVRQDEVAKISASIADAEKHYNDLNARLEAMVTNGGVNDNRAPHPEYSAAFNGWFRSGDGDAAVRAAIQGTPLAAMTISNSENAGYLAPIEWNRQIIEEMKALSSMRQIASVQNIGTAGYSELAKVGTAGARWVGETDQPQGTTNPTFQTVTYGVGKLEAEPAQSQDFIDDALIDVEQWLADEVAESFAEAEAEAFVSGNGTNKPYGLLSFIEGGEHASRHPNGAIGVLEAKATENFDADDILDLIHFLPGKYTANARFAGNRTTFGWMRKLKDGDGSFLYRPATGPKEPSTFNGYPMTELEHMPDIADGATPLAFGDFKRTYRVIDRADVLVLRDPYTNKPFVKFYTTKRVGGSVRDPRSMKVLRVPAAA
ncbi:MAG: phage major capsid protein [Neomegalonema sp.]|nr:phage major capsid protein [Neomegalonema sp.]